MIKVQNCLLANDTTLASIEDASFIRRGESVVVLGSRLDTRDYASKIHKACTDSGLKLCVATGGSDIHDTVRAGDPELTADLLLIADRRARDLGGKPKGAYFAEILARRTTEGRSSIVLAETLPIDWISTKFLGHDTFWTTAKLGMGIIIDYRNEELKALFDRFSLKRKPEDREFFDATRVAPLDWNRDRACYEFFGITDELRPWSWINLHQSQ